MEMRFGRNLPTETKGSLSLQKKLVETRRQGRPGPAPDLTDFMNDMFFGTSNPEKKAYNLTGGGGGGGGGIADDVDEDSDDSIRSSASNSSSKMTQEWLEEAKRMVASSPTRCDSPSKLVGSPRFASSQARSSASLLDRRDPLSRSARRHRSGESFSGEILSKSTKHSRHNSETSLDHQPPPPPPSAAAPDNSPAAAVQKWFNNILKLPNPSPPPDDPPNASAAPPLPPRLSNPRKSRFQNTTTNPTQPQGILSKRTFRREKNTQLLSPPKNLVESAHRRSLSSSTCLFPENKVLSPPRSLVESAHRRSISSSTCSKDKISSKPIVNEPLKEADEDGENENQDLNGFLKEQGIKIGKILSGEIDGKAKIVLSGPSNSTSSMVAAICYAWLLENRMKSSKERVEGDGGKAAPIVVPVMNMRRGKMWKQRQVAWLFHYVGLDATALFFSDEVDLETLMMAKQLSILVVGQDILKTNGEVGSQCTILTDNYCEDAYDLLQTPILKKLLLAGILLDTQNLNMAGKLSLTRDAEAVQLLSVGSTPNYRNALYDLLMQDQKDSSFFEALRHNYGKSPNDGGRDSGAPMEHRNQERRSSHEATVQNSDKKSNDAKSSKTDTTSPKSAKPKTPPTQAPAAAPAPAQAADPSRGKNKFFLAKWFGFGK